MVCICNVRFEHHQASDVLGIGLSRPRISWNCNGDTRDWYQTGYEIMLQRGEESSQTFEIQTSNSVLEPWPGEPLTSGERVFVWVRAMSRSGRWTAWSACATVEAGLLLKDDWRCCVVEENNQPDFGPHRPVVFRRKFEISQNFCRARLYMSAHGVYVPKLNGTRLGDLVLAPGWTSYSHRLCYQVFPIASSQLLSGENTLEVTVSEGWYCGKLGWGGGRHNIYGDQVGLIAHLVIEDARGGALHLGTDRNWEWSFGPFQAAGIYDGVLYDATRITSDDTQWRPVKERPLTDNLVGTSGPPIRRTQEIKPLEFVTSPSGQKLADFGQNVVGWVKIYINTTGPCKVRLRFAEVLEHGEIAVRPLRTAKATDEVIFHGSGPIEWEPEFTFHGFRYVEVTGWPGELHEENLTAIVIHSDMKHTATFNCSNRLLNKLHGNIVWSTRGNFLSIPTDCPQRDERLGWTGDINMFASTANFLFDTSGLLSSWLADLKVEQQTAHGIVPLVIPNIYDEFKRAPHAVWGDVIVMLPWSLYQAFGDRSILEQHYEDMKTWMSALPRRGNRLWDYSTPWKLADWLDPSAPSEDPGLASTDPTHVSDAFLVHVTDIMAKVSAVLEDSEGEKGFTAESKALRAAFAEEYITASGLLADNTQTAYALALAFDLFPTSLQRTRAAERLEYLVRRNARFHIATGFAGTPYIGHALSSVKQGNIFYRMLLSTSCPSWLYPVTMGATTIWERWDSMMPDGSINPGQMTSFNHYALGSVAGWMHQNILGLRLREPGWKAFDVEVLPGGNLRWAEGSHESPYGLIIIRWRIKQHEGRETFWLEVRVPPNTTAHIHLPGTDQVEVVGSGLSIWEVEYKNPNDWPPEPIVAPNVLVPEGGLAYFDEVLPCPWEHEA